MITAPLPLYARDRKAVRSLYRSFCHLPLGINYIIAQMGRDYYTISQFVNKNAAGEIFSISLATAGKIINEDGEKKQKVFQKC